MNRNFRGKDKHSGEWVYGFIIPIGDGVLIHTNHNGVMPELPSGGVFCLYNKDLKAVIPESVGQFTGGFDCEGKAIYEGDIVELPYSGDKGIVEWNNEMSVYHIRFHNRMTNIIPLFHRSTDIDETNTRFDLKVISNIIDHPDMMKGGCHE